MKYNSKEFQFVNRIDSANKKVIMLLDGEIGAGYYDSDGKPTIPAGIFASEMFYFHVEGFFITVKINSPGGSVYDGLSIVDAILDTKANTQVVGMAASMASVIAQSGNKRFANDFSVMGIHGLSKKTGDDKKDTLLDVTQKNLRNLLITRSSLTEEKVDTMMKTLEMTWFDSSDMMECGLVDEVLSTGERVGNLDLKQPLNNLYQIYNTLIKKNDDMSLEKVITKLGISNTSSEDEVVNKVGQHMTEAAKVKELTKNNADLTKENTALKAERAKVLVDNAVEKNLIAEDQRKSWDEMAVTNYEGAKNMLSAIPSSSIGSGTPSSVSDDLVENNAGGSQKQKATANFTSEEETEIAKGANHLLENNEELYNKLAEKSPDRFNNLKD